MYYWRMKGTCRWLNNENGPDTLVPAWPGRKEDKLVLVTGEGNGRPMRPLSLLAAAT